MNVAKDVYFVLMQNMTLLSFKDIDDFIDIPVAVFDAAIKFAKEPFGKDIGWVKAVAKRVIKNAFREVFDGFPADFGGNGLMMGEEERERFDAFEKRMLFFEGHKIADQAKGDPGDVEDFLTLIIHEFFTMIDFIEEVVLMTMFDVKLMFVVRHLKEDVVLGFEKRANMVLNLRKKEVMIVVADDEKNTMVFLLRKFFEGIKDAMMKFIH